MTQFTGEPKLKDLLADPIIEVLMKADGVSPARLCETLRQARGDTRDKTPAKPPQSSGFV